MQRCQRLQILQLVPAPGLDLGLDHTPDLTPGAALAQDPENVVTVLGLAPAPALTLRPTEPILPETIRTTEAGSEATTEDIADHTTTAAEAVAITNAAITRTGEEVGAMATSPTGRVVAEAAAGTIAAMTRTITRTVPGGGAHAHARLRSAQSAVAAPASPTAHLQ